MSPLRWVVLGLVTLALVLIMIFCWGSIASAFCGYGLILVPMAIIRTMYVNKEGESDFAED